MCIKTEIIIFLLQNISSRLRVKDDPEFKIFYHIDSNLKFYLPDLILITPVVNGIGDYFEEINVNR